MGREGVRQLHRYRLALSTVLLLVTLYFILYSWLVVPPAGLFLGWKPETTLAVTDVVEAEYAPYVQKGDQILAIDGRQVRRGEALFSRPWPPSYTFTIARGEQILDQETPVIGASSITPLWKLSQTILALAFWIIGFLTVLFVRQEQTPALISGLGFQLIGSGLVSSAPTQFGAPGAWIVGHSLIFLFPVIVLFLAFFPRTVPLSLSARRLLWLALSTTALLATAAAFEAMFLFPDSSIQHLVGIRTSDILATYSALATAVALSVLAARLVRAPQRSYERQQLGILLFFFSLAVVPLFLVVMLPLRDFVFVPYPLLFSLLLLLPAAYFFVLHRHGLLVLEPVFSRLITITVLVLAAAMTYATGSFLLHRVLGVDLDGIEQGGFLFFLFASVVAGQKPVQSGVELLLYGRDRLDHSVVQEFMSALAADPEPATLERILAELAARLNVSKAALLTRDNHCYGLLAGTGEVVSFEIPDTKAPVVVTLRTEAAHRLEALPRWVELAIPLAANDELLGLFLLSQPLAGHFNGREVQRLVEAAQVLAFGLRVITLVAVIQQMSQQMLYGVELQRQQIATEIHNEPLHTLTLAAARLRAYEDDSVREVVEELRNVTTDLRRIIAGLRPPALTKSVDWMTREVVRAFAEAHPELKVTEEICLQNEEPVPDACKNAVYFILTEALNNVLRHAQARQVIVSLVSTLGELLLEIRDDGIGSHAVAGMSVNELLRQHHFGFADMHWWARLAGGQLMVSEGESTGTTVRAALPLTQP